MGRWGEAGEGGGEGGCTIVLRRAMSVEGTGKAAGGGEVGSTVREDIQTLATLIMTTRLFACNSMLH